MSASAPNAGAARSRGRLVVHLGYAAGVGKTMAMLGEGRRRRERGTDVVVGFVEDHGRAKTREAIGGLEVIPRARIPYRGAVFEEMDTDAVIARHPEVALVDELAHTNVPGSRHPKRWQDVEQLLEAGISVITTVNIQHLESVNDVVERITGAKQRETIPDGIVRAADQIELVDLSPWGLRRRMAHGNIYPPEKVDAALSNYFREGNLTALRELALLWLADRVEASLQTYMAQHGIEGPWETRERVVVAVGGEPHDDQLIRRAARMAARRGGDLLAVHVVTDEEGRTRTDAEGLWSQRTLVSAVGGSFHEIVGADVPRALLEFARAQNATQLVLGASTRSRPTELLRGSVINRVVRESGPIDVHVISHSRGAGDASLPPRRPPSLPLRRRLTGLALATAGLVVLTIALTPLRERLALSTVFLLYLLAVVAIAAVGGWVPAILAAVAASLLVNWFFTPPLHTLTIAEAENILALVVFVLVAAVVSLYVDRSARSRAEAGRGRAEAEALAALAGSLLEADDPLPDLLSNLRTTFGLEAASVLRRDGSAWRVEASAGRPDIRTPEDAVETLPLGEGAVLALSGPDCRAEDRRLLAAFVAQVSAAVHARELRREAAAAAALGEVNELRAALLAAVSHDLRSPLASIKASVTSLRQSDVRWSEADTQSFLATIEEETDRLASVVGKLLDMSRLQAGALAIDLRPVGLDEIVPRALASLSRADRRIELDVPESLSRVRADPALLERVVANVVDNAVTWSPTDRPVAVLASQIGDRVELRVIDRGPGIEASHAGLVFEPFQRLGDAPGARGAGVGLGLAVARGFAEAMGGRIELEETPGGGTTVVISLRAADAEREAPAGVAS
jgi:two-component system sensor histidine kinase KdpD